MTVFLSKKSNILMNTTGGIKTVQLYNLGLSQFKNLEEGSHCLTLPLSCLCPSLSFFISLPIFISRHLPPPFIHFLLSLSLHLFISFLISSHLFVSFTLVSGKSYSGPNDSMRKKASHIMTNPSGFRTLMEVWCLYQYLYLH